MVRVAAVALIAAFGLPGAAFAQFVGDSSATVRFESNSNVLDLQSGVAEPGLTDSRRADTFYSYGAQFDAKYLWGVQQFYASVQANQYEYQHFTELDHDDFTLDAGLIWKSGSLVDGKLDVSRTREMVPFLDLLGESQVPGGSSALSIQTEQRETGTIGVRVAPDWRVEATGYTRKLDEPIPTAPDLSLTENSGTASLKYLGIAGLSSGISAGYLSGTYGGTGIVAAADASETTASPSAEAGADAAYRQYTAALVSTYSLSGRTSFEGDVGYSKRESGVGTDSLSGVTGAISFNDQLTPKTGILLKLDRVIDSYVATSSSEIETDAAVSATWQATYRLGVNLGLTYGYLEFPRQGNNPVGSNRLDHQEMLLLGINYQPRRWLLIRPYANVQKRNSNFIGGDFNATSVGVYVTVQTPKR